MAYNPVKIVLTKEFTGCSLPFSRIHSLDVQIVYRMVRKCRDVIDAERCLLPAVRNLGPELPATQKHLENWTNHRKQSFSGVRLQEARGCEPGEKGHVLNGLCVCMWDH